MFRGLDIYNDENNEFNIFWSNILFETHQIQIRFRIFAALIIKTVIST